MSDEISNLKHALAVAETWVEHHQNHCDDLIKENAALRADKERLDWLESLHCLWEGTEKTGPVFLTRAAIDAARKEAKP